MKVKVYKKPRIGIIPTGTEIIENIEELENWKDNRFQLKSV